MLLIRKHKATGNEQAAFSEWFHLAHQLSTPQALFVAGKVIASTNQYDEPGYSYTLTEPVGQNFNPAFAPAYTPTEMLALGIFGGKYLNDDLLEYPMEWFLSARVSLLKPNYSLNAMPGSQSNLPRSAWAEKGWLTKEDGKGWFQWYCRYYLGRRIEAEDQRQITRWRAFVRHAGQVRANCQIGDLQCRPRQRQALLQWSHEFTI